MWIMKASRFIPMDRETVGVVACQLMLADVAAMHL